MNIDTFKATTMLIVALILGALAGVWLVFSFPLWVNIIISMLLLFSLYYQVMTYRMGLSNMTMVMNIEDRILNEISYQVTKRGYYIKFQLKDKVNPSDFKKPSAKWIKASLIKKFRENAASDDVYISVVKCNMPRWKRKIIKLISFINVVLRPAWAYREFDEEDNIMYNEETDKELVNL